MRLRPSILCFATSAGLILAEPTQLDEAVEAAGLIPVPDYSGTISNCNALTGEWSGLRTKLANDGVTLSMDLTQFFQGIADGGGSRNPEFATNLDYRLSLDLGRAGVIPGALVSVRGQSRFGRTVNGTSGLLLPVNMYSAFPLTQAVDEDVAFALTEANWVQLLSESAGVLLGKITTLGTSNEFMGGQGRTQFMNFQFNFPAAVAQLAPYSTLAGSVFWMPHPNWTITTTLMNLGDASTTSGFDDIGDGTTWATVVDYRVAPAGLPGGGSFGFYHVFDADLARIGGLILDPGQGAVEFATNSGGWALSWSGWQYLWTDGVAQDVDPLNGTQDLKGIGVFLMAGLGDGRTNPVNWSVAGGISGKGLIPTREFDTLGLGYFYNELEDLQAGTLIPLNGSAQGAELYYNFRLLPSADLAINLQWARSGLSQVDDALILGSRLNLSF